MIKTSKLDCSTVLPLLFRAVEATNLRPYYDAQEPILKWYAKDPALIVPEKQTQMRQFGLLCSSAAHKLLEIEASGKLIPQEAHNAVELAKRYSQFAVVLAAALGESVKVPLVQAPVVLAAADATLPVRCKESRRGAGVAS